MFACLEETGYTGLIGFELMPKTSTAETVKAIMKLSFSDSLSGRFFALLGVCLFSSLFAAKPHFFLGFFSFYL